MNDLMRRRIMKRSQRRTEPVNVQPLALQMRESANIEQQEQSPLFAALPKEIRDLIFEYALAAYPDPYRPYNNRETYVRPGISGHPRIAIELLLTCKAVYMETYQLPITLNPVIFHLDYGHIPTHARRGTHHHPKLSAWQWAALHMVDVSLQQILLERTALGQIADELRAGQRFNQHQAAIKDDFDMAAQGSLTAKTATEQMPLRLSGLEVPAEDYNIPRPISKLTLRLGRTEWWTWEDPPDSPSQLGIDPALGDGSEDRRCTNDLMITEAALRRNDTWTEWSNPQSWGAQIASFKGLRQLECVFETFKLKEPQLDVVIDCAKLWKFPMDDGYELYWDGSIEAGEWMGVDDYGYETRNTWLRERVIPDALVGERTEDEVVTAAEATKKLETVNSLPDHRLFVVKTIRFTRRRCKW